MRQARAAVAPDRSRVSNRRGDWILCSEISGESCPPIWRCSRAGEYSSLRTGARNCVETKPSVVALANVKGRKQVPQARRRQKSSAPPPPPPRTPANYGHPLRTESSPFRVARGNDKHFIARAEPAYACEPSAQRLRALGLDGAVERPAAFRNPLESAGAPSRNS